MTMVREIELKNIDFLQPHATQVHCVSCQQTVLSTVRFERVTCLQRFLAITKICKNWSGRHDINHYCSKCGCFIGRCIEVSGSQDQISKHARDQAAEDEMTLKSPSKNWAEIVQELKGNRVKKQAETQVKKQAEKEAKKEGKQSEAEKQEEQQIEKLADKQPEKQLEKLAKKQVEELAEKQLEVAKQALLKADQISQKQAELQVEKQAEQQVIQQLELQAEQLSEKQIEKLLETLPVSEEQTEKQTNKDAEKV